MTNVIEIKNLKKNYGDIKAVQGISLNLSKGMMFGLVGPDGAGKTTTIRILCGLIKKDAGDITVLGKEINSHKKEIQHSIGYLAQKFSLYGDLSVDENIEFFANINDVKDYKNRRDELLQFTRLIDFRDRLADKLSGGMKQKLALACSLIHQPKILFLDEPTTGVDPVSRRDFWKILSQLLKDGVTIFMTTPYLDEAERCHSVALMNNGKIIAHDNPDNLKSSFGLKVIEIICQKIPTAFGLLKNEFDSQMFGDRINIVTKSSEKTIIKIRAILNDNEIKIESERILTPSLENIFIHLIQNETNNLVGQN